MSPEDTYLHHLQTIERIAACVARRNHLNSDDVAEFTQEVRVRLLENDYAIIRKFEGRSSFSTYLTTVIVRLFQQWRVEQWGKWRPSAEAKRLGDKAITIERYLTRDGYSLDEVVSILTTPTGSAYTRKEIEAIYLRLPVRQGRPVMVSDDSFATTIPANDNPADPVEQQEREAAMRFAVAELDRLVESMEDEDRLILQMRFWQGLKVPDIADRLHLQPKKVYKRIDRLLRDLRSKLEAAGVHSDVVNHLLGKGD